MLVGNRLQGETILTSFCLSKEIVDKINSKLSTDPGFWNSTVNKSSKAYYFKQYKQLYNLIQYSELPSKPGKPPKSLGCFVKNTFHGMSWFCHWFKPVEIVFNFAELTLVQNRLSNIGLVDLIGINAITEEDFNYSHPETLIVQRALTPILHSFYLLENNGCLLNWNFGISTRLNIGMIFCLVYCFHKVLVQKFDDCQVLVCKGYRREIGLKLADVICKDMERVSDLFCEESSILEIIPSNLILDKRWFIKCLNRCNDKFFASLLEKA